MGTFSNDIGTLAHVPSALRRQALGGLGVSDPPIHEQLRQLIAPDFTMRSLRRLEPRIRTIVAEQLDHVAALPQPVDLVSAFAWPVPARVICELLGVPEHRREEFQRLSSERFDLVAGMDALFGAISTSLDCLQDMIADQRQAPQDGLLGTLVSRGGALDDRTLAGLADGVLIGGLETSASMIALGTLVLLRDPSLHRRATGGDLDAVVEELLRHLTVVQTAFPRYALQDTDIGGHRVARGDAVLCSLLRANRDPAPIRNASGNRQHLAFGHGIHHCLGAELARMELRIAYAELLKRFPRMRLAVSEGQTRFHRLSIVYGLEQLPVFLDAPQGRTRPAGRPDSE
ncbi:cytochrome P450 [Streptacidiphilus sp. MAP12-16]|uniref:cytochrome P450 n=1 Tax=Streptacidiphilus sp. MAP12-16 TaxID=3156300 RepID=UPI0035117222